MGPGGESLYRNTIAATQRTLKDARVSPLKADELPRLRIEVDVLGRWGRLRARSLECFGEMIEPGIHGVAVEKDGKRALFKSSVAITKNWKVAELIPYYQTYFLTRPSSAFVPWQIAAYAHLFRLTRERVYADFVEEPSRGNGNAEAILAPGREPRKRVLQCPM